MRNRPSQDGGTSVWLLSHSNRNALAETFRLAVPPDRLQRDKKKNMSSTAGTGPGVFVGDAALSLAADGGHCGTQYVRSR